MNFRIFYSVLVVVFVTLASPDSFANGFEQCDALYAKRGQALSEAIQCYSRLQANSEVNKLALYERAFIALSAIVNDMPETKEEALVLEESSKWLNLLQNDFPGSASLHYWRAVFTSFNAIAADRGRTLPRAMFRELKSIQSDLSQAIKLDPSIHVMGPERVLGIMHTRMPAIVGGDKTLAENLLKNAYLNGKQLSANHIAYAKILVVNGEYYQAKTVLDAFMALPEENLNPYADEPLRSVRSEWLRDREEAKQLLIEIEE